VPGNVREEVIARDVVFMAMAVENPVNIRQASLAVARDDAEGGIDDDRLVVAADQQGISVRILAPARPEKDRDRSDLAIFELFGHGWEVNLHAPASSLDFREMRWRVVTG
jgi:hypothetical protein